MLQISMAPSAIYSRKPTNVAINFLLKDLDFVTDLYFSILLPDNFTRLSGSLDGHLGLIQKDQIETYTFELFCKTPGMYEINICNILYYNRRNQRIQESSKKFPFNVVQKPGKSIATNQLDKCIEALDNQHKLYDFMIERFDIKDIHTLLFRMKIDLDSFPNEGKPSIIQHVVMYCERYGRFAELVELVCKARPHIKF